MSNTAPVRNDSLLSEFLAVAATVAVLLPVGLLLFAILGNDIPLFATLLAPFLTGLASFAATYLSEELKWRRTLEATQGESLKQLAAAQLEAKAFRDGVTWSSDQNHVVLLDGPKNAGKSALIAKWANPTIDIGRLSGSAGVSRLDVFLCAQRFTEGTEKHERRHRLVFIDVPGEQPQYLVDAMFKEKVPFVLLVVDPTNAEESYERLRPDRLKGLYLSDRILDNAKGLLVYVSKTDLASAEEVDVVEKRVTQLVAESLGHRFERMTLVFRGSSRTGDGIFRALEFMAVRLELGKFFPRHRSLTSEGNKRSSK